MTPATEEDVTGLGGSILVVNFIGCKDNSFFTNTTIILIFVLLLTKTEN